jgi:hypothetical protein
MRLRFAHRVGLILAGVLVAALLAPSVASAHGSRTYGGTSLVLDSGPAAALKTLGVTPGVIAPARANADGSLAFPITDPLPTGVITHSGGISLIAGSTTVDLNNFDINLFARTLSANVNGARATILDLDFSRANITFRGGRLTVGPLAARLTKTGANALNQAFGVSAFKKGLLIGQATVHYRLFSFYW